MTLFETIKQNEGTKEYQKFKGYFKDNNFYPYLCSEGFWTIGYGHRCLQDQEPITEEKANLILQQDIYLASRAAKTVLNDVNSHPSEVLNILTEMVFQLGLKGVMKFKKTIKALNARDYTKAAEEMKDSKWYEQTPNRVEIHLNVLKGLVDQLK